ncbi:MAG TPA: SagB/ThcOx family dehydrogenase [Bacteroidales bacterium]|nr:SagB/ThcOx family dehydrogenase [Bacteroidales bacterium]HPT01281.1 SagB/ThcOx family dehydrogenase [Bacteroidales bacterium]
MKRILFLSLISFFGLTVFCQELQPVKLLPPQIDKGKSLMQSLQDRHSSREFSDKELSLQELSNLLWAANGVNRPGEKKRTAPSAMNWQDIDIYVFLKEGVYLYNAFEMTLQPVVKGDLRSLTGMQPFVAGAPVNLVLVSDTKKMSRGDENSKTANASAEAAFVGENVYLFCSAFDLNCVLRGSVDREKISKTLNLRPEQLAIYGITIGFPK